MNVWTLICIIILYEKYIMWKITSSDGNARQVSTSFFIFSEYWKKSFENKNAYVLREYWEVFKNNDHHEWVFSLLNIDTGVIIPDKSFFPTFVFWICHECDLHCLGNLNLQLLICRLEKNGERTHIRIHDYNIHIMLLRWYRKRGTLGPIHSSGVCWNRGHHVLLIGECNPPCTWRMVGT